MSVHARGAFWLVCLPLAVALTGCGVSEWAEERRLARIVARGEAVYQENCVGCHGVNGDGQGPAAALLLTKPRDFRQATFKFRSTPGGALPTDDDLLETITDGIAATAMPSFRWLEGEDRKAVAEYVKTFSRRWERAAAPPSVQLPAQPDDLQTVAALIRGRAAYRRAGCAPCHGVDGKASGTLASTLVDDWGHPSRPRDFTQGGFKKAGHLARTILTGMNGTAMASFAEVLDPGEAWDLAAYLRSLGAVDQPRLRTVKRLARDYPEEFSRHVGEPSEAEGLELAHRGAELSFPPGYVQTGWIPAHHLPQRYGAQSNDWYVALFSMPEAVAPGMTLEPMPELVDANGRPTADGLAAIVYLRTGLGFPIMCGLRRLTIP